MKPRTRAAAAARWAFAPPAQARSQETVEQFCAAAEALLRDRPFEKIAIQDIVKRAGRPMGSFYARFASKEALLPLLYARYDRDLESVIARRVERVAWEDVDLETAVHALVGILVDLYVERRWFLRAMALFARAHPEAIPDDLLARRGAVMDFPVRALRKHRRRIRHSDPDRAVRFAHFLVASTARERLLFGEAPHARQAAIARGSLKRELAHAMFAYLTTPLPTRRIPS